MTEPLIHLSDAQLERAGEAARQQWAGERAVQLTPWARLAASTRREYIALAKAAFDSLTEEQDAA